MSLQERFKEYSSLLMAFAAYQCLAFLLTVAVAGFLGLAGLLGLTADPEFSAETFLEALLAAGSAAAIAYGLWLLYVRHPSTRQFWIGYLTFSVLLYGYFILVGDGGCSTAFMIVNLLWLAFWVENKDVQRLFP